MISLRSFCLKVVSNLKFYKFSKSSQVTGGFRNNIIKGVLLILVEFGKKI